MIDKGESIGRICEKTGKMSKFYRRGKSRGSADSMIVVHGKMCRESDQVLWQWGGSKGDTDTAQTKLGKLFAGRDTPGGVLMASIGLLDETAKNGGIGQGGGGCETNLVQRHGLSKSGKFFPFFDGGQLFNSSRVHDARPFDHRRFSVCRCLGIVVVHVCGQ